MQSVTILGSRKPGTPIKFQAVA